MLSAVAAEELSEHGLRLLLPKGWCRMLLLQTCRRELSCCRVLCCHRVAAVCCGCRVATEYCVAAELLPHAEAAELCRVLLAQSAVLMLSVLTLQNQKMGQRDGSVAKSTGCSSK